MSKQDVHSDAESFGAVPSIIAGLLAMAVAILPVLAQLSQF